MTTPPDEADITRADESAGEDASTRDGHLSATEQEELVSRIRAGRPLPARYRATLFDDAPATELIWPGKTYEVERTVLPFQSIEHIDEPRPEAVTRFDLFSQDKYSGRQTGGWTNKLIWGDNKLVLSSLANGPLRAGIEAAGGLRLVYIDPPFDVGANFSFQVEMGGEEVTKAASVIEEVAYRDTWGRGRDSYASMMFERLQLISSLMAPEAAIFVHLDWRVNSLVRLLLDEVFGSACFRNEIVWRRAPNLGRQAASAQLGRVIDTILVYTKKEGAPFRGEPPMRSEEVEYSAKGTPKGAKWDEERELYFTTAPRGDYTDESIARLRAEGRVYDSKTGGISIKYFLTPGPGGKWFKDQRVDTLWDDFEVRPLRHRPKNEDWGYDTQKPEGLLERIISWASAPGDLVADFFCGSGTTLAVAERLGRKWIGADLGRFAIHTSRKRLITVQRELRAADKPYRAFEVLNLGKYERQYFAGLPVSHSPEQTVADAARKREEFVDLILGAYGAQRADQLPPFSGTAGNVAVFVGPIDAPVTENDITEVVEAARAAGVGRADILGFEFEMGVKPALADLARERGVSLGLRYIPRDVFDKRAVARGDINFYDVGYLEVNIGLSQANEVAVELADFSVFYAEDDPDVVAAGLRNGASKVVVDSGQVIRVEKSKRGVISTEVLTKSWTDWVDYWAVDYDFESQKELITVRAEDGDQQVWTGRYIFENEWQSFRTKLSRDLELRAASHRYADPGTYRVAVKVVDVFGNDTTRVYTVEAT